MDKVRSDKIDTCCVRGCDKHADVVVAHLLFCAEHALERERQIPLRRR